MLLSQNDDPSISEVAIQNEIAQCYIVLGEHEKGLDILKRYNVGGIHNALIAITYMGNNGFDPKDAEPYMMGAFGNIVTSAVRTMMAYEIESIIQQNVFVFNATIKDNITMFRDFSDEQIDEAIRLSGLTALIEEKGADYLCGENGGGLSGGEKQRISIARSLLKKSQVLLVDEATAALDAETAYQVSGAILGLEDVTSIVVTHSLEEGLLKQYDGIITLKNGAIVEAGTFDELIEEKGYFYSLFTISQ